MPSNNTAVLIPNDFDTTRPTRQSFYLDLDPYGPLGLCDPPPDPASLPPPRPLPSGNARRRRRHQRDGEGEASFADVVTEVQEEQASESLEETKTDLVRMQYAIKLEAEMELRASMKDDVTIKLLCVYFCAQIKSA